MRFEASTEVVIYYHVGGLRIAITQVRLNVRVLFVDPAGIHAIPDTTGTPRQAVRSAVWTQARQLRIAMQRLACSTLQREISYIISLIRNIMLILSNLSEQWLFIIISWNQ